MRILLIIMLLITASRAGKVYLVLGSDTAIWEGMSVANFNCTYNPSLYLDPGRNTYAVMDPAFRAQHVDSDGTPVKLTWWMMAGNIFRYATNTNFPVNNIMTMYLMKQYHGENIIASGDELSLHYHTFNWTDYDGDGNWYWNQALSFPECRDDFDFTLAQFLLEEQVFPVSFRSGWHFMYNPWQAYLNELIPYSMHNDWPSHSIDLVEPLDNSYDWSQATPQFVPFQPSPENYQLPGGNGGWNVRSVHFRTAVNSTVLNTVFEQASQGIDQVACLWGHLPEDDFVTNISLIDAKLHQLAQNYPNVQFYYCTAVEAMQRWRATGDNTPPQVEVLENISGDLVNWEIRSDEAIFQQQPFLAVKDIYENYQVLQLTETDQYVWQTTEPLERGILAKAAVALCDPSGNQTIRLIKYLPEDQYIDNGNDGFSLIHGSEAPVSANTWGPDAVALDIAPGDSVVVRWVPEIEASRMYSVFLRQPGTESTADSIVLRISNQQQVVQVRELAEIPGSGAWYYAGTAVLDPAGNGYLELVARNHGTATQRMAVDVARFSPLVRERWLVTGQERIDLGMVSIGDTARLSLMLENRGIGPLTVTDLQFNSRQIHVDTDFPQIIPAMNRMEVPLRLVAGQIGAVTDTLVIQSDDPARPRIMLPFSAEITNYFQISDNDDPTGYVESGSWYTSVAQAWGGSSRYSGLNSQPGAWASFTTILDREGEYDISGIVPTTANGANNALYELSVNGVIQDSVFIDQNYNSGSWVVLWRRNLPAGVPVMVRIADTGQSTNSGVLRADAILFRNVDPVSQLADAEPGNLSGFELLPNYPNPFNPSTTIEFVVDQLTTRVELKVFDLGGREVATLESGQLAPGRYRRQWNGTDRSGNPAASGMYFYRLQAGERQQVRKMILLH